MIKGWVGASAVALLFALLFLGADRPSLEDRLSQHRNLGKAFYENPTTQAQAVAEFRWPCQKPPWGQLVAVNANTGDFAWRVTAGITLPEGKKNTGRLGLAGPIVTARGLVFLGATNDNRFQVFDTRSGRELWSAKLEYEANAVPMTYQGNNGKQYIAIMSRRSTPTAGDDHRRLGPRGSFGAGRTCA